MGDGRRPDVDVVITEIGGTVGDIESLPFLEAARQVRTTSAATTASSCTSPWCPTSALGRAQDQADPALGRRAALDRHPARRDRLPGRPRDPPVDQEEDLADVRRRRGRRRHRGRRPVDLRHPEGAAPRGPRRLRRAPPRPARSATSTGPCGTTCSAGCTTPRRRSPSPWSASTSTCPTPTSRWARRCGPAASPTRPRCRSAGSPPTSAPTRPVGPSPARRRRDLRAGRLRRPRPRRRARRADLRADPPHPHAGPVPGPAVHGHRVRPQRGGPGEGPLAEFDPDCPEWVIATMEEQKAYVDGAGDLGGTMRLGLYPAVLKEGSIVRGAYGEARMDERHRHRYEVNNAYREQLEAAGIVSPGPTPTTPSSSSWSCRETCTPTTSRPRRTPSSVPADPPAPALRGWRGGLDRQKVRALPDRRDRAAPGAGGWLNRPGARNNFEHLVVSTWDFADPGTRRDGAAPEEERDPGPLAACAPSRRGPPGWRGTSTRPCGSSRSIRVRFLRDVYPRPRRGWRSSGAGCRGAAPFSAHDLAPPGGAPGASPSTPCTCRPSPPGRRTGPTRPARSTNARSPRSRPPMSRRWLGSILNNLGGPPRLRSPRGRLKVFERAVEARVAPGSSGDHAAWVGPPRAWAATTRR